MAAVAGGRWVAEVYGCNLEVLENPKLVELALKDAVIKLGAPSGSIQATVYKFYPQGLSAAVLSPVAAVMMHTWPEDDGSATLDLYFYKPDVDPEAVLRGPFASGEAENTRSNGELRKIPEPFAVEDVWHTECTTSSR